LVRRRKQSLKTHMSNKHQESQYSKTITQSKMTEEKKSGIKSKNYNGVEVYQCCCNMNKRNGLARFQSGIWKPICIRRDGEKER